MTGQGVSPLMPFWGLAPEQIDRRWTDRGHGVEALLFRRQELQELARFEKVLAGLAAQAPLTCHFPMDANYLDDAWVRDRLHEFLDVSHRQGAAGVVLHPNYLVDVELIETTDFDGLRARCLSFLADLDARIAGSGMWIGVENMPLMGDLGDDVDAAFVYPEDFDDFAFDSIGITFDFAHWMGTLGTTRAARQLGVPDALMPPTRDCDLLGFARHRDRIRHLHLSAVSGVALPPRRSAAAGGAVPGYGEEGEPYRRLARALVRPGTTMSLEVQEADYGDRVALWETLRWLVDNGYVAADEPDR